MNRKGQTLSSGVLVLIAIAIAIAAVIVAISVSGGESQAGHDSIACNDDVPAGWTCVPLVNKPQSGPGVTSPAVGELLFKFSSTSTLLVSVRALPGQGAVDSVNAQFCLDDDNEPYNAVGGTEGNQFHDCTGAGAAGQTITDGTGNIPAAGAGEESEGANGVYEVRVTNISTDGAADGLTFAQFNDVTGYLFFVYHVNIGDSSTQAFFERIQPPTLTVEKVVVNDNTGTKVVGDFTLRVDGGAVTSGVANTVSAGAHVVSEADPGAGYTATIGGDCDASGNVTLAAGENKTCTITNNDVPPTPTPSPTPSPTTAVLGETQAPETLPETGGAPGGGSRSDLPLLLALGGLFLLGGAGTLATVAIRRRR